MPNAYYIYEITESENYELENKILLGPNEFRCYLQTPEDATWHRDGKPVVLELNRLHDEKEILRSALVGLVGEDDKEELEKMATMIRALPVPQHEQANILTAIDALLTVG